MMDREIASLTCYGFAVKVDAALGHLWVEHDGNLTWDQLQEIKAVAWGREARAIEVYPAASKLVNSRNCRHLWRLGPMDFCPDLLGLDDSSDGLQARHAVAWSEARG